MSISSKRILSIGIAGILFIMTLVVYANMIQPEFQKVKEARGEVFSKISVFNEQKDAVQKVQALIAKLRGTKALQDTVSLAVPIRPEVARILNQVQAIARNSQVTLKSFSFTQKPFEAAGKTLIRRLGVLGVDFQVEGSYEGIKSFTRALETNVRIFNVEEFALGSQSNLPGAAAGVNFFSAKVGVEAYYQEEAPFSISTSTTSVGGE